VPALTASIIERARRRFYNAGGPWYRCRLFEALGSERYSHPAMYDMDRKLAELMPWKGGTFLEAGAHDGYTQSNTYYLERHLGWSGVLVEPIPELRARCERRRPNSRVVNCALVAPDHGGATVTMQFGDLMSIAGEDASHARAGLAVAGRAGYSIEVPARTASSVLDEAGLSVDLMVLDVEGNELDVLAGLDLERHAPRYLLVEALDRAAQQRVLDSALASYYEPLQALSEFDLLYRHVKADQLAHASAD
jgi:FkbM family methyltransferase